MHVSAQLRLATVSAITLAVALGSAVPERVTAQTAPAAQNSQTVPEAPAPQPDTEATPQPTKDAPPTMAEVEQAWQRGDFVFVRRGLAQLAETEGSALAQFRYGKVLVEGTGGPRDIGQGVAWLEKAAAQDSVPAATLLARVLLAQNSTANAPRAAELLSGPATRGDTEAQLLFARLLQTGLGLPADPARAADLLHAASDADSAQAQYELSKVYAQGLGREKDSEKALRWLRAAAEGGQRDAQYYLAAALNEGRGVAQNKAAALDWFRRAAEAGQPAAQRDLGTKYLLGDGDVPVNLPEALRWLTTAAKAGDRGAMNNLGLAYSGQVEGLPANHRLALHWYERASSAGLGRASLAMGVLLAKGASGTDADNQAAPDMAKALEYFDRAARQGEVKGALQIAALAKADRLAPHMAPHHAVPHVMVALTRAGDPDAETWLREQAEAGLRPAQAALGAYYLSQADAQAEGAADATAEGSDKDASPDSGPAHTERRQLGLDFLQRAAQAGSVPAQFRLGMLYSTGAHLPLDYVKAHQWLNIAAAGGHDEAGRTRNTIGALMTPEQIAEAQTAAREFFAAARAQAPQAAQTVRVTNPDGGGGAEPGE